MTEKIKVPTQDQIRARGSMMELREIYEKLRLLKGKAERAARGHLFEDLVARMLELSGGWEHIGTQTRTKSEEFDVVGDYNGEKYFFELKWKEKPAGTGVVKTLESTLSHRPGVRGIMVDMEGSTEGAREWAKQCVIKQCLVVLFGEDELRAVLSGELSFNYLLDLRLESAMVKQDPCGPSVQDAIEKLPRIPAGYRDWVLSISAKMELLKLSVGDAPPVGLPEVYIPLYTDDFPRKTLDRVKDETPGHEETGKPPVDIEILISREPYLLLEGLPGSGKTTMIRHLARRMMLGEPPEGMDGFLPIVVFLSDLNRFLDEEGAPAPGDELLVRALGDYLGKKSLSTGEVLEYCRAGRALLMLDGLDELKEMHRPVLVRSLQHFREHNPMTRFVLTTRPHAVDVAKRYFGDRHREIHTLKREQKADFIHRWFAHLAGVRSTATEETAGALLERMDRIERMDELVDTPLMLTAICILYMDDKELPEQRADLYDRVVNNLLEKRFRPYEREDKRYNSMPELIHELLGRLAVLMMKKETRTVTMDEVLKAALDIKKGVFKQMGTEHADGYKTRLADLFRRIEGDCGLLDHGESGYNFRHLTFQEFLAAWRILSTSTDPWAGVEALVDDPLWQESIMLYVGLLAGGRMPMLARTVIEKLLGDPAKSHRILLGARSLLDLKEEARPNDIVEDAQIKLQGIIRTGIPVRTRIDAGDALGRLGDPRLLGDPMVEIPGGRFWMGAQKRSRGERNYDEKAYGDESPVHRVEQSTFSISKYPITVQQYRRFMEDGGYKDKRHWKAGGFGDYKEPGKWEEQLQYPSRPVVYVSWCEAAAYAAWAGGRLPTEAEWERAARGPREEYRKYPWGNAEPTAETANYFESKLGYVTPVGIFPEDCSPEGVFDMAGNCREWCGDWYEEGRSRVVRGGAFSYGCVYLRSADRVRDPPDYRSVDRGFRVVRVVLSR